jgi:NAD(P)-dependent dehydrogenase (short-subunit alcohol dehydrogenase family)
MRDFRGRAAVITGAANGIGRGMAHAFADAGMNIVVADTLEPDGEKVVAELREKGVRSVFVKVDVSDLESVRMLAEVAYATFGEVHLLCNNAGVGGSFAPIADLTPAEWRWMLGVNLEGVINGLSTFLPRMLQTSGERHIINTGSMASWVPLGPGSAGYTTTKYAVLGLTEVLREEVAPAGIGVSVLCPGEIATNMAATTKKNRPAALGPGRPQTMDPDARNAWGEIQAMDPLDLGKVVRAAVENNDLYIFTFHVPWKLRARERFERIMAAHENAAPG